MIGAKYFALGACWCAQVPGHSGHIMYEYDEDTINL